MPENPLRLGISFGTESFHRSQARAGFITTDTDIQVRLYRLFVSITQKKSLVNIFCLHFIFFKSFFASVVSTYDQSLQYDGKIELVFDYFAVF